MFTYVVVIADDVIYIYCAFVGLDSKLHKIHCTYNKIKKKTAILTPRTASLKSSYPL